MQWDDLGFLLSKNKYNENSIIAEFFTQNHGKCSGIIFGGTSKKIKNYLQIGNKFHINYNYKNDGRIGYFKIEIFKIYTPIYFDNRKKLLCISSGINLVKLLTVENQTNKRIFDSIGDFFFNLNDKNWIKKYILWELELFKTVGYDLDLNKISNSEYVNNKKIYFVKSSNEKKYVPNFLVDLNDDEVNDDNIIKGLKLVSDYLEKSILKPNNINYPSSRLEFINLFK